jgi:hypothetical protein
MTTKRRYREVSLKERCGMDFKVRCVSKGISSCYTEGKVYAVNDGKLASDLSGDYTFGNEKFQNVQQINTYCATSHNQKFELAEEEKMFTKDDIKGGYLVECRCGELNLIMPVNYDLVLAAEDNTWGTFKQYDNDLICTTAPSGKRDIMKVWGFTHNETEVLKFKPDGRKLLWERKEEPLDITIDEIAKWKGVPSERIRIKE